MITKRNNQISFRIDDERKTKLYALAHAEGKDASVLLTELVDSYINERADFIASIASVFGYIAPSDKDMQRQTVPSTDKQGE